MRKKLILGVAAATLFISGCADMNLSDTQRRSAMGAGVGALGGAVLSSATGGKAGTGAVLGAGVGALGTYIWSQNMEKQKREMEQAIVGHTDNTGSDAINNPLSVDRANSTRNYLTQRGVSGSRIQVEGRGSYQPIASNNTSDGRSRNRRVEIFVGERPR